tara:strand:- start:138887 stop:140293 length:1407 start_codon:yes stop_codon:yes gene_type:complete
MSNNILNRDYLLSNTFLILGVCALYLNSIPITTADSAIWLKLGDLFWQNLVVVTQDPFSFLKTKEMIYPSWGAGAIYSVLNSIGGIKFVDFFHKFYHLVFIFLSILFNKTYFSNKLNLSKMIFLFLSIYLGTFFINRPAQLVTIPFLLTIFIFFSEKKTHPILKIFYTLIIGAFWINIHGSGILFPLFVGLSFLISFWKRKAICPISLLTLLISISILFLTPFGTDLFPYILETSIVSKARGITEWDPIFSRYYLEQTIGYFLLLAYSIYEFSQSRIKQNYLPPFIAMNVLALSGIRHSALPAWMAPIAVKENPLTKEQTKRNPTKGFQVFTVILLFFGLLTFFPFIQRIISPSQFMEFNKYSPVEMVKLIDNEENIFNEFEFGSYLVYSVPNKIFMDTRNIIYSEEQFEEYKEIMLAGPKMKSLLDKYDIQWILVGSSRKNIVTIIEKSPKWKVIQKDEHFFLAQKI